MGLVMAGTTLYVFTHFFGIDTAKAYTMSLTVLAALQWWNAWNVRSERDSIFSKNIFSNPYLVLATIAVIFLQLLAIYNPTMQAILKTTALSMSELAYVVGISFVVVLVEEARKFVYRIRHAQKI